MPHSEKRTTPRAPAKRTPQRHPRKVRQRAGGPAGDAVRNRLRRLIGERGESQGAFARACGVSPARVTEWLSGSQLPSADRLRTVAERTGVSLDWLLLGDGGDGPVMRGYRGERRTGEELAADVGLHVLPRVRAAAEAAGAAPSPGTFAALLHVWEADGAAILRDAVEQQTAAFLEWAERQQERYQVSRAFIHASRSGATPTMSDADPLPADLRAEMDQLDAEAMQAAWRRVSELLPEVEPPAVRNRSIIPQGPPSPNGWRVVPLRIVDAAGPPDTQSANQ